jgi:hypothetical protein
MQLHLDEERLGTIEWPSPSSVEQTHSKDIQDVLAKKELFLLAPSTKPTDPPLDCERNAVRSGAFRKAFARARGMCRELSLKPYARAWHEKRIVSARHQFQSLPTLARLVTQRRRASSHKNWPC